MVPACFICACPTHQSSLNMLNMPRRRTVIGMAVVLAAFVVVFLVQPEVLRQLSRSSRHQQLRYSGGEGVCAK